MIGVAIGVHVAIVAALPKARPAVTFAAPVAAAAELAPHVSTLQVSAAQLVQQQPKVAAPAATAPRAPKPATPARIAHATTSAPARDDNKTIDMRPRHDDAEPVLIATPLPVTIVVPPSDPR
jgi:hypothetical protein